MSDDKPPPQPPTVRLPALTDRALLEDLARTTRGIRDEVGQLRDEVDIAVSQGRSMNMRLTRVEEKVDELDGRMLRNSSRVKSTSENDLTQDAAISKVIVRIGEVEAAQKTAQEQHTADLATVRTELAANTAVTDEVKSIVSSALKHPAVIALGLAIVTFLTAWIGRHMP